jgi:ATP-dependent Lhr-like helicase
MHWCETTEPSVLAHEIITARPYAFLDDEEFQNRRTNAVRLRRGLNVDLSSIGALDPDAIAQVHAEIDPDPASPDDLHDLLSSLVATVPRDDWRHLWQALEQRGRVQTVHVDGRGLWCTTEGRPLAEQALSGASDEAAARLVRGHLELSGVTTAAGLASATGLREGRVAVALAVLERDGSALQGRYTGDANAVQWVARRLLARMHSYSRRSRRESVQAATAQDFMRFLLRWQHLAPDTQLTGDTGLTTVIEQLQGFEAAAVGWEPELIARRVQHYSSSWLDRLCHDGEVAWLRLAPRPRADVDAPAAVPSKATPIAVVFRSDLDWLLEAARAGAPAGEPTVGATAEIIDVLRARGASFATDLVAETRRLPDDVERGLWGGVTRGLIMCDGFGAIRARVGPARLRSPARRLSRLGRAGPATVGSTSAGRWALVPSVPAGTDRDDLAEAVAEQLLRRWGVVFRDLAVRDAFRLPWREVQWALRRLEDRGLVRGGRFVGGFSGEQYALPEAAEQLAHVRKLPRRGERVLINATDPLNLVGVIVPGEAVPALRTNQVVLVDGVPEMPTAGAAGW